MGATLGSEATAAADNQADIRRDPMAMLPFCGYNMGDYWKHWLGMERRVQHAPKIFRVNWFRKTADGKWLWPGFGQNMRVLEWVMKRIEGQVQGQDTVFGTVPNFEDISWNGLTYDEATFDQLMAIDNNNSRREFEDQHRLFVEFGGKLPAELEQIRQGLLAEV
jgi:phosphoenolpyruvate carboxykinase (GTP)